MRNLFLIFCLMSFSVLSQVKHGASFETGLNLTGLHFDPAYQLKVKKYELGVGLRFMGVNQVFERRYPGLLIRNGIYFTNKKKSIGVGTSLTNSFFYENKTSSNLFLANFIFGMSLDIYFLDDFVFYVKPGIGGTYNYTFVDEDIDKNAFFYLNYEFALGIKYTFPSSAD